MRTKKKTGSVVEVFGQKGDRIICGVEGGLAFYHGPIDVSATNFSLKEKILPAIKREITNFEK